MLYVEIKVIGGKSIDGVVKAELVQYVIHLL